MIERISPAQARSVVVAAQLATGAPDAAAVLHQLRLIQLDPLSRVEKAHRLTCAARLPANTTPATYDADLWPADHAVSFETHLGVACVLPAADWPLFGWSRAAARSRRDPPPPDLTRAILKRVTDNPSGVTIGELESPADRTSGWNWSATKRTAEILVWQGRLVCTTRRSGKRVYDLPERRLDAATLAVSLDHAEMMARLAALAVRTLGVATVDDVARHYCLRRTDAATGLELSGARQVDVAGWDSGAAYVFDDALHDTPSAPTAAAAVLVGPFDSLLRNRNRARRVFGFDYLFEAYKPAPTRRFGAYVMGVMKAERFVARVDAQRTGRDLVVHRIFPEASVSQRTARAATRQAGARLAQQLGGELLPP